MKCVCGYKHQEGLDDNGKWQDNLIGDIEFHRIHGSTFKISEGHWGDYDEEVKLYACPKCGTVRMERS
jgi:hypothetical protein